MNYIKIYHEIILKAKFENRKKNEGVYYEKHHITPRCKNGDNAEENLVLLTGREHFLCHKLLHRAFPKDSNFFFAYKMMTMLGNENRYIVNSKDFEMIRIKFCEFISNVNAGRIHTEEARKNMSDKNPIRGTILSEEHRKKISEANTGHIKTEETIQKIKDGSRQYWDTHESWWKGVKRPEETIEKQSQSLKEFWANVTDEYKEEWSKKFSSENNGHFGKPRPEETKDKISKKKLMRIIFDGIEYESINDASEKLGNSVGSIRSKLNREQEKGNENYHYVQDSSNENRTKARVGNRTGTKRILFDNVEYESMTICGKILGKAQTRISQIMKEQISKDNLNYEFL